MKIREVGITKTRIRELHKNHVNFGIGNLPCSTRISFDSIPFELEILKIDYGTTSYSQALELHSETIKQFESIGIHNDDEVIVLFDTDTNKVLAIGKPILSTWIDVEDNFKVKSFGDLNIIITDLNVY